MPLSASRDLTGSNFYTAMEEKMPTKLISTALAAGILLSGTPSRSAYDANQDGFTSNKDLRDVLVGITTGSMAGLKSIYENGGEISIRDFNMLFSYLEENPMTGELFMKDIETTDTLPSKYSPGWVSGSPSFPTIEEYGTLTEITYYSSVCEKDRKARVYLPASYDESKSYPVLYILHGYWGHNNSMAEDAGCQNIIGKMIADDEAEEMIVVFPDIFASKKGQQDSCTGMNLENSLIYDNCVEEITTDLMPYIEENYSALTGRDHTAVCGFSMGGREALAIGLMHPDKFGYIAAFCPAPGLTPGDPSMHPGQLSEDELVFPEEYSPYLLEIFAGDDDQVVWNTPKDYSDIFTRNGVTHKYQMVSSWHGGPAVEVGTYNFAKYIFKAS